MKLPWEIVARGLMSPRGPAADRDGNVFLASQASGKILQVDCLGHVGELCQTGGKPQSLALLESGDLVLTDAKNPRLLLVTPDGQLSTLADHVNGMPFLGPNDLVMLSDSIIFLTDSGLNPETSGQILRIDLEIRKVTVLADELLLPHGITLSNDGRHLFVAEGRRRRVWRYRLLDNGHHLGERELFHQFDHHYPAGIAFDSDERLLVALCGSEGLAVLSPNGFLLESISVGGANCTSCVFGGDDFQTLYVTENDQESLLRTRWPVPGQRRFSRSLV